MKQLFQLDWNVNFSCLITNELMSANRLVNRVYDMRRYEIRLMKWDEMNWDREKQDWTRWEKTGSVASHANSISDYFVNGHRFWLFISRSVPGNLRHCCSKSWKRCDFCREDISRHNGVISICFIVICGKNNSCTYIDTNQNLTYETWITKSL